MIAAGILFLSALVLGVVDTLMMKRAINSILAAPAKRKGTKS